MFHFLDELKNVSLRNIFHFYFRLLFFKSINTFGTVKGDSIRLWTIHSHLQFPAFPDIFRDSDPNIWTSNSKED